jgi:hypothetical protein
MITLAGLAVLHMFKVSTYGLKLKHGMGKKAPLRVVSKTAFATVKSTIDTFNSSNTVLLFLDFNPYVETSNM